MKVYIATEIGEPTIIHGLCTIKENLIDNIVEKTNGEMSFDIYMIDVNTHPVVTADDIRDLKKYNDLKFVEHYIGKQLN